jgi:Uncharacterized alpha/beta hydrolase domain (DUF2235)
LRVAVAVQRRGQRIGGYHMPRNLVLCFDGTNREFGQNNTNIVRLVQVLDRSSELQLLYYDPGVGTLPEPGAWGAMKKRISRIAGLAFGASRSLSGDKRSLRAPMVRPEPVALKLKGRPNIQGQYASDRLHHHRAQDAFLWMSE